MEQGNATQEKTADALRGTGNATTTVTVEQNGSPFSQKVLPTAKTLDKQFTLREQKPSGAKERKEKRKVKKSGKFKVTKFDKDAVKLIVAGKQELHDICKELGVDFSDAKNRFGQLAEKGYLMQDARDENVYRLGVEGYNKYAPKVKAPHEAEQNGSPFYEKVLPTAKTLDEQFTLRKQKPLETRVARPTDQPAPLPSRQAKGEDIDLGALLKAGAPQPSLENTVPYIAKPFQQVERSGKSLGEMLEQGKPAHAENGSEKCGLCLAPFKLSVKDKSGAKYGHCFCGAAYHGDCYESLLAEGGRCVRCGKKLALIMNRDTEDAVKGIKDAFE